MTTAKITGVQFRLMGDDASQVEAAIRVLKEALGDVLVVSGSAPMRDSDGLRVYGAINLDPVLKPARKRR